MLSQAVCLFNKFVQLSLQKSYHSSCNEKIAMPNPAKCLDGSYQKTRAHTMFQVVPQDAKTEDIDNYVPS